MFEYVIVAHQITWSEDWNLGSVVAKAKEECEDFQGIV